MKSWKTTLAGVCAFVAVLAKVLSAQFDGDPSTVADWAVLAAQVPLVIGLFVAGDHKDPVT